jgi:general secretion pathway protein I
MPSRSRRSSSATASCDSARVVQEALTRPGCGERCAACERSGRAGRRLACGGFTLLEILVALAILGISLGVIFQGIGQGLRLRGEAAENVRLALVAESLLGQLPERAAAPEAPEEGEDAGILWRLESVETPAARGAAPGAGAATDARGTPPVAVRLTVTAPSGRSWEMSTLLPRSAESVP